MQLATNGEKIIMQLARFMYETYEVLPNWESILRTTVHMALSMGLNYPEYAKAVLDDLDGEIFNTDVPRMVADLIDQLPMEAELP